MCERALETGPAGPRREGGELRGGQRRRGDEPPDPARRRGAGRARHEHRRRPARPRVARGRSAAPGACAGSRPPAFRHRLVESARAADKRIVLPEGTEPRTIAAAAIVQERGIARCVLLGNPDEIRDVARKQGVTLPASLELLDPAEVAPRYVEPLVERRRSKGMTPEMARSELADTIMVGTMMMALDEADGLVSGRPPHDGAHDPPGAADHQDRARLRPRVERVLHVPAGAGARLRRLRGEPEPHRRAARRHRDPERRLGARVRHRAARRDALLLDRHERRRRGRREGEEGDRSRAGAAARPRHRRPAPVRRRDRARRRAAEGAEVGRGRPGDGVRVPGPQHRERHLQGRAAQRERGEHRPDAAGAREAGERPQPRLPRRGHRLHHHAHRDPGAAARGASAEPRGARRRSRRRGDAARGHAVAGARPQPLPPDS